jgi:hypothetical protein
MPGHIEYSGAMFEGIEDRRLEQEERRRFVLPTRRDFCFFVSETKNSTILELACTSKSSETGPSKVFQAGKIVSWATHRRVPLDLHRPRQLMLVEYFHGENIFNTYLRKSYWQISFIPPAVHEDMQHRCRASYTGLSLILITSDNEACDNLRVHKTSTDFWQQANASFDQLYAEYGRVYQLPHHRIYHYELSEVGDCPTCILNYLSSVWPHMMRPLGPSFDLAGRVTRGVELPEKVIRGSMTVHRPDQTTSETNFDLTRISAPSHGSSDNSRAQQPRACRLSIHYKPFPLLNQTKHGSLEG